jgi:protein gp37
MSIDSKIEWTNSTWNPTTGCTKVSPACQHCYAERFSNRFKGVEGHPFEQGFRLKLWHNRVNMPISWKKPRLIFVNSMSDLFLEEIPDQFISQVYQTMLRADWHTYQILTKRADRMVDWFLKEKRNSEENVPRHIWLGVSVETEEYVNRIRQLKELKGVVKFVSFEPLLGPIRNLENLLKGIDWVIVGGESGHGSRRMREEWIDPIHDACMKNRVPFFFKQWGEFDKDGDRVGKAVAGRKYKRRLWNQMPAGHSQI